MGPSFGLLLRGAFFRDIEKIIESDAVIQGHDPCISYLWVEDLD